MWVVSLWWSNRRVTGLSAEVIADLVAGIGPVWQECQDARLADKPRRRAPGAGARGDLNPRQWVIRRKRMSMPRS